VGHERIEHPRGCPLPLREAKVPPIPDACKEGKDTSEIRYKDTIEAYQVGKGAFRLLLEQLRGYSE
jgi:hypothetical protein